MPVEILNNSLFRIQNLKINYSDKLGCYLTLTPGHCTACVLLVSRSQPPKTLDLSESELERLYNGNRITRTDYYLQGIAKHQLLGNFTYALEPPTYVYAWGMSKSDGGDPCLFIPDDSRACGVRAAARYQVHCTGNILTICLPSPNAYQDGDLLYRYQSHPPIPIPKSWLNKEIPLRHPADEFLVFPSDMARDFYERN